MNVSPVQNLIDQSLAVKIKDRARMLGFDLAGIAPADPSQFREYLRRWLDEGRGGSMSYLNNRFDERTDPSVYLPGAQSVICVAMNYFYPLEEPPEQERPFHVRIARYALGDDYHELMKRRLHELADCIRELAPQAQTRAAVDTAPVLERELAARAGIGWVGKNTCIIHPRIGSWLFLGQVLTTLPLPTDEPIADHCGTCTRCIDACPTAAITAPYQLDASRCISYLTIEHRAAISDELRPLIGEWLYGCDICQDVCPHNSKAAATDKPEFKPRFATGSLDVREVMKWDEQTYREKLRNSAMKRVKLPVFQRNAAIVAHNGKTRLESK